MVQYYDQAWLFSISPGWLFYWARPGCSVSVQAWLFSIRLPGPGCSYWVRLSCSVSVQAWLTSYWVRLSCSVSVQAWLFILGQAWLVVQPWLFSISPGLVVQPWLFSISPGLIVQYQSSPGYSHWLFTPIRAHVPCQQYNNCSILTKYQ